MALLGQPGLHEPDGIGEIGAAMKARITARWNKRGELMEENQSYHLMGVLKQIGTLPDE